MISGPELIDLARCTNAKLHFAGRPPRVVNPRLLGRIGHHYDLLIQLNIYNPLETGAMVVCLISKGTDGGSVFAQCSTCTAAYLLSFILLDEGYQKVTSFSKDECAKLANALKSGNWRHVAKLFKKKYKRSVA